MAVGNIGAFAGEQWWMLIMLFLCGNISLFADIFITLPVFLLLPQFLLVSVALF